MSSTPRAGTFYLVGERIVYSLSTSAECALDHLWLFPRMIDRLFPNLPPTTRKELRALCIGAIPRGRCIAKAELDPFTHQYRHGSFTIFCDSTCQPFERRLRYVFGLDDLPSDRFSVKFEYTDNLYQVQPGGALVFEKVCRENRKELEVLSDTIRIAGAPRRRESQVEAGEADALREARWRRSARNHGSRS